MNSIELIIFKLDSGIEIIAKKGDDHGYDLCLSDENHEDPEHDRENVAKIPIDHARDLVYALEFAREGACFPSETKSTSIKIEATLSRKESGTHLSVERAGALIFISTFYVDCREFPDSIQYNRKTICLHIDSVNELIGTILVIIKLLQ